MAALVWISMGTALWHFTIFLPDRFVGGIVGAFLAANLGAVLIGFLAAGLTVPGRQETTISEAIIAAPGGLAGLAVAYAYGSWRHTPRRDLHQTDQSSSMTTTNKGD